MIELLKSVMAVLILFSCLLKGYSQDPVKNKPDREPSGYFTEAGEYYTGNNKDSTRILLQEFFAKAGDDPGKFTAHLWVTEAYQLAVRIFRAGDYEFLSTMLDPLLNISVNVPENHAYGDLGKLYNILAMSYKNLGLSSESIPIYLIALENLKKCETLEPRTIPEFYINLGNALRSYGDLSQANKYYDEALRQIDLQLSDSSINNETRKYFVQRKSITLNSIGLAMKDLSRNRDAIKYFSESLELTDPSQGIRLAMLNNNIGLSYSALDENDNAESNYKEAIKFHEQNGIFDSDWVLYSLNYSDLLIKMEKYEESEVVLNKIHAATSGTLELTAEQLSTFHFQKSRINLNHDKFQAAMQHIDLSLSHLTGIVNSGDDFPRLPGISLANTPLQVISAIEYRARVLKNWGNKTQDSSLLTMALENYKLAETCIDSLRVIIEGEESKINLSRIEKSTHGEKIDLLWKLHEQYNIGYVLFEAFETAEKGKAAGIWNLIQLSENKEINLPVDIQKKDKLLRNKITDYNNLIRSFEMADYKNTDSMHALKNQKFLYERQLDSLANFINQNYPEYNTKKFQNKIFSVPEIMEMLNEDQVLIQYFFSENFLHEIFLSRDTLVYNAIPDSGSILEEMEQFNDKLKLTRYDYSDKDVTTYQELAYSLYTKLIKPFEHLINYKDLIILPDESLAYIPFEALVTSGTEIADPDFRHLNYLVYKNPVSYSYTASMWAYRNPVGKRPGNNILGFAPTYDDLEKDTGKIWNRWLHQLPELPGTLEEVEILKRTFTGKTFFGNQATEEEFKAKVSDFKVLHLAMHTVINDEEPVNSFLVFTPFADNKEDGRLYPNEIRNLELNSALTVLSACKSGSGELASGEGVMSISRMFLLAGSGSVIMTLWSVDDQASLKLIEKFYKQAAKGETITKALYLSKLGFIEDAGKLHAHPYFWAGFIQLGRDDEVKIANSSGRRLILIASGLLIIILITIGLYKAKTRH